MDFIRDTKLALMKGTALFKAERMSVNFPNMAQHWILSVKQVISSIWCDGHAAGNTSHLILRVERAPGVAAGQAEPNRPRVDLAHKVIHFCRTKSQQNMNQIHGLTLLRA